MEGKVTPALIKELRDRTAAGMLDCKKALEACECDMDKAIDWLREKGITKAAKKADRVAAEGLCSFAVNGNDVVLYELNSETDFVAQNDKFLALLDKVGNILANSTVTNTDEALKLDVNGKDLATVILEDSSVIGEKISLRNVQRLTKKDNQVFGTYKHNGGNIVVVDIVEGSDVVAKDVAMHVAAMAPKYVSREEIPADVIEHEKSVILAEALNENAKAAKPKPEQIVAKMVEGRLNKELKEVCLLDQAFVKNQDQTVAEYAKANGTTVCKFVRLKVGEGIEKVVVDFAAEVAAQAGLNK
jgi:elongation factor Ts